MSERQTVLLHEVADIIMGQSPAGATVNTHQIGDPLLNGPTEFGTTHPVAKQWTSSPTKWSMPGDILFCVRGSTTGRMNLADQSYCIGRGLAAIRGKSSADTRYIHAFMRWNLPSILQLATGSTFPNLSRQTIAMQRVPWPEASTRERIASVLGAFDDLIETNRAQASRAARLARAAGDTFMSTLTGRNSLPLSNFCQVVKGFSYKSAELVEGADTLVNLKNIGRTGTFERRGFKPLLSDRFKPGQVLVPGDVVVSMTDLTQDRNVIARPVRVPDATVEGRMVASLDLAVLRPINGFSAEFLLAALAREEFRDFALGFCNGTTVLHLGAQAFDKYRLPAVSPEETSELVTNMSTFHALEDSCLAEAEELARTRDELLPLLMSGKVRVDDVEIPKGAA